MHGMTDEEPGNGCEPDVTEDDEEEAEGWWMMSSTMVWVLS